MFDTLFGNRTAATVLLFIGANRDAYAQEIAEKTEITLSLIQAQLRRLEQGGVLVSMPRGRMRFYSFNPRFPFARSLEEMLQQALDYMPAAERNRIVVRRRPRMQGKPL